MSISSDYLDEELDYEVDEDVLLESDEENLVKKMSSTSVTPATTKQSSTSDDEELPEDLSANSVSDAAVITSVHPANFRCPSDFWLKSISTLTAVMNAPTPNEAIEPEDTPKDVAEGHVKVEVEEIQESKEEEEQNKVTEPEQLQTEFPEPKQMEKIPEPEFTVEQMVPRQADQELNQHMKQLAVDRKDSTETNRLIKSNDLDHNELMIDLSSKVSSPPKPNKISTTRNLKESIAVSNGVVDQQMKSTSVMSNGTFPNEEDVKYFEYEPLIRPALNPITQPPADVPKRIPFIIKARTDGDEISRRVMVNPIFDGFSGYSPSNMHDVVKRKRQRSNSSIDLRDVVINKRRAQYIKEASVPDTNELSSTKKEEEVPIQDIEGLCSTKKDDDVTMGDINGLCPTEKENEVLMENGDDYLLKIEKQKLKREKFLREKELRRQQQGWCFDD